MPPAPGAVIVVVLGAGIVVVAGAVIVVVPGAVEAVAAPFCGGGEASAGGINRQDGGSGNGPEHRRRREQRHGGAKPTTARSTRAGERPQYPVSQVTSGEDRTAGIGATCDRNVTLFRCQSS
jgi:hypothetical protein